MLEEEGSEETTGSLEVTKTGSHGVGARLKCPRKAPLLSRCPGSRHPSWQPAAVAVRRRWALCNCWLRPSSWLALSLLLFLLLFLLLLLLVACYLNSLLSRLQATSFPPNSNSPLFPPSSISLSFIFLYSLLYLIITFSDIS